MNAAPEGPQLFSVVSSQSGRLYRTRAEAFLFSLLGQVLILGLLTFATCCVIGTPPGIAVLPPRFDDLVLVFSGRSGAGGGGNHEKVPASHGNIPQPSLADQLVPPTLILPKEMPKLAADPTVMVAPNVQIPQGGQLGDPLSSFSQIPSQGPGGPGGFGDGCCNGDGDSIGPGAGSGPPGIFSPGKKGVTVPQVIYSPEPSFSDEARKAKQQGEVVLLLVVGKDGRPYNIRIGQSLGMGLDEKAIEAVGRWRFRPATLNGQPVATQIAVEVDFHLY